MARSRSALRSFLVDCEKALAERDARGLRRELTPLDSVAGPLVRVGGATCVNWSSNDYLGLSQHPRLAHAASEAAHRWGVGARASRLLSGSTQIHADLERALAAWFRAPAALVFSSGYLANLGVLGSLAGPGDMIFLDRLCHASLVEASRLSRATLRVFSHNDAQQLATLLRRTPVRGRRIVVTEGVFSMDGDCAPVRELVAVAERHNALVYLDDAHGAFVRGKTGRGSPEEAKVPADRLVYMATLGKALGCQGGFVVGPQSLIDWITNQAKAFIYATALAVPVAAAAREALLVLQQEPRHRLALQRNTRRLRSHLSRLKISALGSSLARSSSPIAPVRLGGAARALAAARYLRKQGIWCPAVRPPTVPQGTSRLRISVTAAHTLEQVDDLARALQMVLSMTPGGA